MNLSSENASPSSPLAFLWWQHPFVVFNPFSREILCFPLTCSGLFEFVFSAHRGMELFILVVWLQGMAAVQLDWVISHLCLVAHQRGAVWIIQSQIIPECEQAACVHCVRCINWMLSCVSARTVLCVSIPSYSGGPNGNEIQEQQSFVSYQMIVGYICWELLYCWSDSCYWLGLKPTRPNPGQFAVLFFPHLFSFHLNF